MKIVTPLLKKVVYPTLSSTGVLRRFASTGLAIVTYHGVFPEGYEADSALDGNLIAAADLTRHLRLLRRCYDVISPEDFYASLRGTQPLPRRAVLLTCDDGLLNCLTDMLPVLRQENVTCLFFVTGASLEPMRGMLWYEELFLLLLGAAAGRFEVACDGSAMTVELGSVRQRRAKWWSLVKQLSQFGREKRRSCLDATRAALGAGALPDLTASHSSSCRRYGLMNATEIRQLAAAGMTIGAHTMNHPMLSQAPEDVAYGEIAASKKVLEDAMEKPVWAFAYPFGDPPSVSTAVLNMPERAGFAAAFMNCNGGLGCDLPTFALPRIHATADMSGAELEAQVSGFYGGLRRVAGRNSRH